MCDCNKADTLSCDKISTELDIVRFPGAKGKWQVEWVASRTLLSPLVTLFLEPSWLTTSLLGTV